MFGLFKKGLKGKSTSLSHHGLPDVASRSSLAQAELRRLKREAMKLVRDREIDAHLFTLFEELKAFSVWSKNNIAKMQQYPFLNITDVDIQVIGAELGGVVMKFISAELLDQKICLGFGVFPKSESDFRFSTNALHLSINDQKFIAATYVIHYSETGRNWRLTDVEEFHNLPEAEPLLREFSNLVTAHRIENMKQAEIDQIEALQKKFSF